LKSPQSFQFQFQGDFVPNLFLKKTKNTKNRRPEYSVRIVGGKAAEIGQYPWLVNLGYTQVSGKSCPLSVRMLFSHAA
jgi:secreted trypsin-like serine protease